MKIPAKLVVNAKWGFQPPTLDSAEQAAEFIEIAWQGLLQDVPFSQYRNDTTNPLVLAAVKDLNRLSGFKGPKENGRITPELLFRGTAIYVDASGRRPVSEDPLAGGVGAPYNPSNPYNKSKTQSGGSGTFGPGYSSSLIGWVSPHAIRAAYWQKYYVHRRLRSEAFGGLVHNNKVNKTNYPLHPDIFQSEALDRIYSKYQYYLPPQFFPEGAPTHSSYPSGASVSAGASVTILKALFDGDYVIPNPVCLNSQRNTFQTTS